jgi:hypothetical protein
MSDFEFASKDLTAGQLNAIVKKLGGENIVRGILADRMKFAITVTSVLVPLDPVTIGPINSHNPNEFFTTREGLWISDQAKNRFLSVVDYKVDLDKETTLQSYALTESANDATIRENLPENHVFGADELCAILAHFIESQPNGKEGNLLANGYANLFYVKGKDDQVCVVHVDWYSGGREWYVLAWSLDDCTWDAEYRVFSRNC